MDYQLGKKPPQAPGGSLEDIFTSPLFLMGANVLGADNVGSGLAQGVQQAGRFSAQKQNRADRMAEREYSREMDQKRLGLSQQRFAFDKQRATQGDELRSMQIDDMRMKRAAGPAQLVRGNADNWNRFLQADPKLAASIPDQFRGDPILGADWVIAKARGYVDPTSSLDADLDRQLKQARLDALQNPQTQMELGLQTIMGRDANGNPVLIQPSKSGAAVQTQLPEGVTLDYGGKARETVMGKAQGEAAVDLPSFERKSQQIVNQIDALINDPKLPGMTGYSAYLPNVSPSSQGTQARMDQVTGKAFVQAFQDMKGAGAITEIEGAKAAAALTRLQNPYQSDADYRAALDEFKQEVQSMADIVRSRASGIRTPQQQGGGGWSIQRVP